MAVFRKAKTTTESITKHQEQTTDREPSGQPKKFKGMFSFSVQPATTEDEIDVADEIKEYLREKESCHHKLWTNPKWKNYKIREVARRLFSIPATSASSERVFSKAGLIIAPLRSSTGEKTLEKLCFLRCNISFVENPRLQ